MTEHTIDVDLGGGRHTSVPVDLPSNSKTRKKAPEKAADTPKKKPEKIISGAVVQKKKGMAYRFKEAFAGEGSSGVVETIITDILIAALKAMISDAVIQSSDAVRQGFDRWLYGYGETRTGRTGSSRPVGYTNYNRIRRYQPKPEYGVISPRARAHHEFEDLILESRGEAEEVIDRLREIIEEYGVADVGELYDLVGITGEFTDNKWGWYDLTTARVRGVRGGYLLALPRPQPLD